MSYLNNSYNLPIAQPNLVGVVKEYINHPHLGYCLIIKVYGKKDRQYAFPLSAEQNETDVACINAKNVYDRLKGKLVLVDTVVSQNHTILKLRQLEPTT